MYKIVFLLDAHTPTINIDKATKKLDSEIEVQVVRQMSLDVSPEAYNENLPLFDQADFIFITGHGSITTFKSFNAFMERYQKAKKIFFHTGIQDEVDAILPRLNLSASDYLMVYRYFTMSTEENYLNLFLYLASVLGGAGQYKYIEPKQPQWEGLYRINESEMSERIKAAKRSNRPIVAVLFSQHLVQNEDLKHINALIDCVEKYKACVVPIYTPAVKDEATGRKGIEWILRRYLMEKDESIVDVIINTIGYSMTIFNSEGNGSTRSEKSVFADIRVPVIQAFSTYFQYDQWRKSIVGLDAMALVSGIYYPEFDGQIGGYPIASHHYIPEKGSFMADPIPDRIDKVVRLSLNWARLRSLSNEDKKVAIIFHNTPPRNDMIGCAAGLDSPASVFNIIEKLKSSGIHTEYNFESGDEIIRKIIDRVSNDTTWMSPEDMIARSIDTINKEQYQKWYNTLSENVRFRLEKDWGEAPGHFMVHEKKMPVPGILNGNIFIGLQPPRAFEEKAEQCYHSCDFVCPHQYIAFYKWVKHVFKADVIMHIGTHGTIEWLPGKEKGLSDECFPDVCIDDIPHLYPYHVSVVGEGIQAKRRSSAVLLSHLIPSMKESGVYDQLTDLDNLIKEYLQSSHVAKAQIPTLQEDIWKLTVKLNLHTDLQLNEDQQPVEFDTFIAELHSWTETIKQSEIKDGLHIFGHVPEGDRFNNLLRLLVRIKNGNVASLPQATAEAIGFDYEEITNSPDKFFRPGITGHLIIDECTQTSIKVVEALAKNNFNDALIHNIIDENISEKTGSRVNLEKTLRYICQEVQPKLNRTFEELEWCETGINGGFVAPHQGGCPSRGNVRILPTGRNFFAIDPAAVPSRAAYQVGKRMAEELIARYCKDEEHYPESIGIVLYAGDQMKTSGDDIAEVLYLMGIRPVWLGTSSRVTDLELIPLEELGRPRIDVTCRISGLLRDTFPNLIEMIDRAVNMVAAANEPLDQNFIRKHVTEELDELTAQGMDPRTARQEALLRVFSCPTGTYGGGVDILIESKKWESTTDLATISVTWSCHAYSTELHGKISRETYSRRLAKTDVTVKNENSVEFDIYEIDDEYIYHGGMIAAVTELSGKKPRSYYGNSANPEMTKVASVREETARIVRARLLNPQWIEGLKQHGYKGAQDVSYNMDNLFGWDATADTIEKWMYDALAEHWLFNPENKEWMDKVNPWAARHINERMLEAIQRGMWKADEEMKERLANLYVETEGILEDMNF